MPKTKTPVSTALLALLVMLGLSETAVSAEPAPDPADLKGLVYYHRPMRLGFLAPLALVVVACTCGMLGVVLRRRSRRRFGIDPTAGDAIAGAISALPRLGPSAPAMR